MTGPAALTECLDAGRAYHRRGELAEAERHYLSVLLSDPHHGEALKLLAVVALDRGDLARAAELAESALVAQPRSGECLHLLGRIKIRQGELQSACRCLSEAVESSAPELEQALLDLSACLAKL